MKTIAGLLLLVLSFVLTSYSTSGQNNMNYSTLNILLKGGYRIFLPCEDGKQAYVMGEINQPATIAFKTSNLSLSQAPGHAGSLDQLSAKGNAVYVIHRNPNDTKQAITVYKLDARSPPAFVLADAFTLKAGGVVFVDAAGITHGSRFVNQLLPRFGSVTKHFDDTC